MIDAGTKSIYVFSSREGHGRILVHDVKQPTSLAVGKFCIFQFKRNKKHGLILDWIRENMYWVANYHYSKEIFIARTSGIHREILNKENSIIRPTSVALDLNEG